MKESQNTLTPVSKNSRQIGFRFETNESGQGIKCVERTSKEDTPFVRELKKFSGIENDDVFDEMLARAASVQSGDHPGQVNLMIQSLAEVQPRDLNEARLCLQASALYSQGMGYLKKANNSDMLCHSEFYMKSALKLLRLHNETLETLNRYRRGGEQKVVVQHVNVSDSGQAIVGNIEGRGGEK
jgi:hypothetical protein